MTIRINAAETNRSVIYYIPEVTWGTTPGSGVVREMRIVSSTLSASKQTKVSQEIRADRMVSNIIEVGAASAGNINWEFSAGTLDDFFQQFLLGSWSLPMKFLVLKGSGVSITGTSEVTLQGADYRGWLTVGQYVKLEGFTHNANNGYVSISVKAYSGGNTVLTINETVVVEAGSAYTKFIDAGDVILASTLTEILSGNVIQGTGSSAFSGKTLVPGQKIYFEGLGKATGTVTCETTNPTAGDTITVNDGTNSVVFEINTSAALITPGHVFVTLSNTEATLAANFGAVVNDQFRQQKLRVSAAVSSAVVTLTNHYNTGGSIVSAAATVTISDFAGGSASKSGFLTIASLPTDDKIAVVETITADANSGSLPCVIKGSHLRNPGTVSSITKQSMAVETQFTDVAKYFKHGGMRVGEFKQKVMVGDIVTGDFSLMGADTVKASTTYITGGSYTVLPSTNTEVMNATSDVGSVVKDGSVLTLAIMEITLDGKNTLREQRAVGSKFPAGVGYGRFMLSGTLEAYFQDFTFYDNFINHDTVSLSFNFSDVDHNTYFETIPALKITSDPIHPEGIDKDVMEKMNWEAQRDPVLNTQFMMDRFSSVYPFSRAT